MNNKEKELLEEVVGKDPCDIAEKAGFISGFKYAVRIMGECYAEDRVTIEEP